MFDLNILSILFLFTIPTIISISMNCYFNARLILPLSTIIYNNLTLQSCQCLIKQQNISGFQYNNDEKSCCIFGNDSLRTNIRVQINSQVCFINRTATSTSEITTVAPTFLSPPISTSISLSGNNYYQQENIYLTNTVPLTSLLILINVPKTLGVYGPTAFTNFWGGTINQIINETDVNVLYSYQLISGQTIVTGQWQIAAQFRLTGQVRSTSNDTYIIQIQSYQPISSHF